jgi:hypothetical protein
MPSAFDIIAEDFTEDLNDLKDLVKSSDSPGGNPRVRIAAANSTTLLLAATFEEFIREMARAYAREVVNNTESFEKLPSKMASTAWKRTMDGLARIRFDATQPANGHENPFGAAMSRFSVIHDFCRGDLSQDIYRDLIHNENNMRPNEINSLFKLSGLSDVCKKASEKTRILDFFGEADSNKAHGKLLLSLEDFFERRNSIAHALNSRQSNGPGQILNDIELLESFGLALSQTLAEVSPNTV